MTDDKISFLKQIADQLVAHSSRFEPFVPSQRHSAIDSLSLLGTLDKVTSQSLAPLAQAKAQARALVEASKVRATPAPGPATVPPAAAQDASSRQPGYRPALKDPSVVEALLRLQQKAQIQARKSAHRPQASGQQQALANPQNSKGRQQATAQSRSASTTTQAATPSTSRVYRSRGNFET